LQKASTERIRVGYGLRLLDQGLTIGNVIGDKKGLSRRRCVSNSMNPTYITD